MKVILRKNKVIRSVMRNILTTKLTSSGQTDVGTATKWLVATEYSQTTDNVESSFVCGEQEIHCIAKI